MANTQLLCIHMCVGIHSHRRDEHIHHMYVLKKRKSTIVHLRSWIFIHIFPSCSWVSEVTQTCLYATIKYFYAFFYIRFWQQLFCKYFLAIKQGTQHTNNNFMQTCDPSYHIRHFILYSQKFSWYVYFVLYSLIRITPCKKEIAIDLASCHARLGRLTALLEKAVYSWTTRLQYYSCIYQSHCMYYKICSCRMSLNATTYHLARNFCSM